MNSNVDSYLEEGCGRCDLYQTPECKVHTWKAELPELRRIILSCGLKEEVKWGVPCYMVDGKNVFLLSAFKHFASINFFKGSLLDDPQGLLVKPGEHSQAGRFLKVTSADEVLAKEDAIRALILDAVQSEKEGKEVQFKTEHEVPEELQARLESDPLYREHFEALTPGRKRSYYIYIGGAKQSKTREARVEKCFEKIRMGKGWNEY